MMTRLALAALFMATAAPALADDSDLCRSGDTPFEDRVAACERVLEAAADPVLATVNVGRAFEANDANQDALHWYERALDLDPDNRSALGRRSVVLGHLDRWEEAEATLRRLLDLYPESHWGHYRLGWVLLQMDRYQDSLVPLRRALEINPDYEFAWSTIAVAHGALNQDEAAGWAMREATRLRPFENDWHLRAYQYFNWADLPDEAAYHARIAVTLDPNQTFLSGWFDNDYMQETAPPDLPPMPWTPPPEDREIRYFAVLAPVDQRDEMEIAIGALASFFGGTSTPLPETATVLRLSFEALDEERFLPHMVVEHQRSEPERPQNPRARHFTMFPFEFQPGGPGTPVVEPRFDGATPGDIWPLVDGNAAAGSGRYVVDCSQGRGFQYSVLGCLPDVEQAELGDFDWSLSVSTERVHVPLGIFDTYRIDVSMTARIEILGVERELPYTASFWVAPELNAWVARIFTVGEQYAHNQAMEIVEPVLSATGSE